MILLTSHIRPFNVAEFKVQTGSWFYKHLDNYEINGANGYTMNFSALGDGINANFTRSSSPHVDRMYPYVDSLLSDNSFEEIDSDTASVTSVGTPISTPPISKKYLYPKREYVDLLHPEEIRWFYKKNGDKKWTAFIGYDSLRIECRYRVHENGTDDLTEAEASDIDLILVRGGLYEVDVPNRKCKPVYWSGDACSIMRGTWFYDGTWQPVEDGYSTQIETEFLGKFLGHRLDEGADSQTKTPKPVLLSIRFADFFLEWTSSQDVFMFSDSTSSRLMRAVGNKLGVQKSGGKRIHRGYCYEACMEDKPADITHLVFLVHGIGQKMDTGHIVRCTHDMRERVDYVKGRYFPNFESSENQRAEFLPVEWRSSLLLDGDTVESLTPQKMRGVRVMLNASAMDILYYTSPTYRSEITHSLEHELNRLYDMFCERHPYFEPNGGKVSVIAHSLGCVITYDIITGWNPLSLYDQYVTSVIEEEGMQAAGSTEVEEELNKAKKRVKELETLLNDIHDKQHKTSSLKFQVTNLFCLGSPLGVFLALRGVRPKGKGTLDHIIPKESCTRLFNIYHPSDPVAYRLEPLILKHYSTVTPLVIHRYDALNKTQYTKMESRAFAAFQSTGEALDERSDMSDRESTASTSSAASKDNSPAKRKLSKVNDKVGGWLNSFSKSMSMDDESMSAELKMFNRMKKEAARLEQSSPVAPVSIGVSETDEIDQTDLEYRLDYQLRDGGGLTSGYIAILTSHTSYWTNRDIAYFLLTHLHPELQET